MTDIWKESYESFTEQWGHFIKNVGQIEKKQPDPDARIQVLRMRKLIAHLGAVIESIEPQLLGESTLDALNDNINHCHAHLDNSNFRQANRHLDIIATALGAFHLASVVKTESMQKLTGLLRKFYNTVDKIATESDSKSENLLTKINEKNEKIDAIFEAISQYHKELFDGDEEDEENESIKTRISNMKTGAEGSANQIQEIYQRLFQWNGAEQTVAEHIETLHGDVSQKIQDTEKELSEINKYHAGIFGEENEDGEIKGGLKQEAEERKKAIDALEERIEALLPGATNAGLAFAYNQLKDEAHKNEWWFRVYFILCVGGWLLLGGGLFIYASFVLGLENWSVLLKNILTTSPIMVPLAILTAFFSKRRSEQHRLKQEYAHKEALAKSYDSFKKQVEALAGATADKGKKDELLSYLMETMIEAIGFNPAKTLDKKHGDDTPSKNPVNRIMEKEE